MTLLITYASPHGSTAEMARTLAIQVRASGHEVDLIPVENITTLEGYKAVIMGAPIHCGVWVRPMYQFLYRFRVLLRPIPVYAWITCMRVLEEGGEKHARQYYIADEFHTFPHLRSVEIFAGKIIPTELVWQERFSLEQHYDGLQDVSYSQGDHRDWDRFKAWGQFIIDDLDGLKVWPFS